MCTSVQNIHIPANGISAAGRHVSFDEVAAAIVAAVDQHLANPRCCAAPGGCRYPANHRRYRECAAVRSVLGIQRRWTMRNSCARTASPLILEVTETARDLYRDEIFGPVSFIIRGDSIDDCLRTPPPMPASAGHYFPCVFGR